MQSKLRDRYGDDDLKISYRKMRHVVQTGPDLRIPYVIVCRGTAHMAFDDMLNQLISDQTAIVDFDDIEGFPIPARREVSIAAQNDESQGRDRGHSCV